MRAASPHSFWILIFLFFNWSAWLHEGETKPSAAANNRPPRVRSDASVIKDRSGGLGNESDQFSQCSHACYHVFHVGCFLRSILKCLFYCLCRLSAVNLPTRLNVITIQQWLPLEIPIWKRCRTARDMAYGGALCGNNSLSRISGQGRMIGGVLARVTASTNWLKGRLMLQEKLFMLRIEGSREELLQFEGGMMYEPLWD